MASTFTPQKQNVAFGHMGMQRVGNALGSTPIGQRRGSAIPAIMAWAGMPNMAARPHYGTGMGGFGGGFGFDSFGGGGHHGGGNGGGNDPGTGGDDPGTGGDGTANPAMARIPQWWVDWYNSSGKYGGPQVQGLL